MLIRGGMEITISRDVMAIVIPDGTESIINAGHQARITQVLGGMFTIQTDEGYLFRISGQDADALGQPVPEECRVITKEEIERIGIEACVLEQLKTCYDPEIPVNIVDLGLIYDQEIQQVPNSENFIVRIEMTLTAPGCGMGEVLKSDVEKKLKNIPLIQNVLVDLVFDPPWESAKMSEAAKLQLGFL